MCPIGLLDSYVALRDLEPISVPYNDADHREHDNKKLHDGVFTLNLVYCSFMISFNVLFEVVFAF